MIILRCRHVIYTAFYVAKFGLTKCIDTKNGEYWAPVFKFIHNSADNQDRLTKICIINSLFHGDELKTWLKEKEESAYQDINGFAELREHLQRDDFLRQITFADSVQSENCCGVMMEKLISYICLPIYLFGRFIHLIFPVIIYIINLGIFGIDGLYLLHHVLSLMFIGLMMILIGVSYKVINFTYCIYHIGYVNQAPPLNTDIRGEVDEKYVDIIQLPIIIDFFDEEFGEDVSKLIIHYLKSIHLD